MSTTVNILSVCVRIADIEHPAAYTIRHDDLLLKSEAVRKKATDLFSRAFAGEL